MSGTRGSNNCAQRAKILSLLKTAEILARDLLDAQLAQSIDRAIEDACIGHLANGRPSLEKDGAHSRAPVVSVLNDQRYQEFTFSWKALGADLWSSLLQRQGKGNGGLPQ